MSTFPPYCCLAWTSAVSQPQKNRPTAKMGKLGRNKQMMCVLEWCFHAASIMIHQMSTHSAPQDQLKGLWECEGYFLQRAWVSPCCCFWMLMSVALLLCVLLFVHLAESGQRCLVSRWTLKKKKKKKILVEAERWGGCCRSLTCCLIIRITCFCENASFCYHVNTCFIKYICEVNIPVIKRPNWLFFLWLPH